MRQRISRLVRKTLSFSKKLENHIGAIAYFNLGMIYTHQNRLMDALKAYQQAITLQPDYPEAHQNFGVTAYKAGLMAESLAAFQQAIALYEQQRSPKASELTQTLKELGILA